MNHLDLFSGIGGFAYAVDQVWPGSTHTFCDNNLFCQKVLAKHWPESEIYGDIRTITNTNTTGNRTPTSGANTNGQTIHQGQEKQPQSGISGQIDILTGGFPCQPFSQAGKRRGTSDERYLWPEMLRVIQLTKPTWVIAENVRGFVTWNEGMVLEQVCLDLEGEGYEVQPFIIPAVAVNAPHRRDRVWIVAHSQGIDGGRELRNISSENETQSKPEKQYQDKTRESKDANSHAQNSISLRSGGGLESSRQVLASQSTEIKNEGPSWEKNWIEVATELCSLDDGLPVELGEFKLTKSGHRTEQLKAYGNAIVPQVVIQIMKAIKDNK